jgi:hypothetical protein
LATGQLYTTLANYSLVAGWELLLLMDKIVSIRLVTSLIHHLHNLLVTPFLNVESVEDVLLNCSREEDRLLLDK